MFLHLKSASNYWSLFSVSAPEEKLLTSGWFTKMVVRFVCSYLHQIQLTTVRVSCVYFRKLVAAKDFICVRLLSGQTVSLLCATLSCMFQARLCDILFHRSRMPQTRRSSKSTAEAGAGPLLVRVHGLLQVQPGGALSGREHEEKGNVQRRRPMVPRSQYALLCGWVIESILTKLSLCACSMQSKNILILKITY